jgi:predicted acyltransferase
MILVNSAGSREDAYAPLLHATWFGWSFADTIFPFFMWIVGVSLMLSSAARLERGERRSTVFEHALQRSVLLFVCGVALEALIFPIRAFPYFSFESYIQVSGVLQKIAICYLAATATFLWSSWRSVIVWIVLLNLVYLGLIFLQPVPGCSGGVWTVECNFVGRIDRILLSGHLRQVPGTQDPDGLGSMITATTSVLFGVLAGYLLQQETDARHKLFGLLMTGVSLILAGYALAVWIPIGKPLWTSSYAVVMAGLASICMGFWFWVIEVKQVVRWFRPFEIYGMNAIAAYILSTVGHNLGKVHLFGRSFYDVCLSIAIPANASLLFAAAHVLAVYVVVWWMFRRRWFLRF